ncbi:glycerate kinase [Serratia sp. L9]|uniref:glycerate kinase n=1 Tax=Serratia sp. L9 TaxID=3423946 RepID=UPI003D67964B
MKIVIAPDSYKESLSAFAVASCIEAGFREVFPQANYLKLPMADGGEGTVAVMVAATAGRKIDVEVTGPLGEKVMAFFGLSGDGQSAFIEMAAASGLELVPIHRRNPLKTNSYGTGELIRHALDLGVKHCIIGIGGSATNDGGAGMVQALGARLLDSQDQELGLGGEELARLARIDISGLDARIEQCKFEIACDVTNPLTGANGASAIFGPQKGATEQMVAQLDSALHHYAQMIKYWLDIDVEQAAGAGAAGGMGAALLAFCRAELRQGIEIVTEALGLDELVRDATLVITGEGRLDSQSLNGKVPIGVAKVAKRYHKPVIGIAGSLSTDVDVVHQHGIDAVFSVLHRVCTLEEALANAGENVRMAARNIAAVIKLAQR